LGSPIFFTQVRITKGERPFKMCKFRTMTDARDCQGNLLPDTERFTKFGNFLRRSSLDELPELLNVLKGDMSLVGPRPLYPFYIPYYTKEESLRHSVRAGITGLAQINGRALCRWNDRFAYDVKYVKELSFWKDVKILWRTFFKVAEAENIGIPSEQEELGLHLARDVQQPEKVKSVEDMMKRYGMKNVPTFTYRAAL
jgi:lipopolysaccharide/colanic/teichoic acid biosynthesis glycosyltransferase